MNNPQIGDSLYGCQWHLNNLDGEDINVEAVWAEGNKEKESRLPWLTTGCTTHMRT